MEPAYLILVGWFGGIALAWVMPVAIRNWHIARQNRLIEDCRARYILAVQALADGDEQIARASLTGIRDIELPTVRPHFGVNGTARTLLWCN